MFSSKNKKSEKIFQNYLSLNNHPTCWKNSLESIAENPCSYQEILTKNIDRKFFVEVKKDGMAGSISAVVQNSRVAEIKDFYIVEGPEDSGIRDKLLEKAIEYCKKHKVYKIQAAIFPDLKDYFKSKGFITERRLKDHFQSGEDTLIVSKILGRK